ncbi:hypothetical protein K493DRAFT_313935 [Basidiobolus meristosporus CBS 931.73]|uniref:arginine--tRNA ligase n=1 Tax=Basidiobolus meristosporus CBS 931.73 TaxID=1314790 RepID=A0A1Y1YIK4_9FUNG|nr:hypothetical protein K493DRAFT_313935 [Basidiobolus meristosporus CBS 931.73]|eukprot:ORX97778.1 hypothetical protein K493DRAFT_313935 [Basidiobolus meristosporus CBS 931.73]
MSWRFYHTEISQILCSGLGLVEAQVVELLELTKLRDVPRYGELQCSVDRLLRVAKLPREELLTQLEDMFQDSHYEMVKSARLISFRIHREALISSTLGGFLTDSASFYQVKGAVPQRVGLWNSDPDHWRGEALETFVRAIHEHLGFQVQPIARVLGEVEGELAERLDLEEEKLRVNGQPTRLGRELAAFRAQLGKVDKILYVGEDHLKQHVYQLGQLMNRLGEEAPDIQHVPYGPLTKPALEKEAILASGRLGMQALMKESENRYADLMDTSVKVDDTREISLLEWISEVLAETNWLVQLLQLRRQKPCKFDAARMLDAKGHSGVYLQYTHARISGVERKSDIHLNRGCSLDCLVEPEARQLTWLLATFSWHVEQSYTTLEPCLLIHYLFLVGIAVSNGLSALRVKNIDPTKAEPRWVLFWCAREVLRKGFQLIGIQGLDKM